MYKREKINVHKLERALSKFELGGNDTQKD